VSVNYANDPLINRLRFLVDCGDIQLTLLTFFSELQDEDWRLIISIKTINNINRQSHIMQPDISQAPTHHWQTQVARPRRSSVGVLTVQVARYVRGTS